MSSFGNNFTVAEYLKLGDVTINGRAIFPRLSAIHHLWGCKCLSALYNNQKEHLASEMSCGWPKVIYM